MGPTRGHEKHAILIVPVRPDSSDLSEVKVVGWWQVKGSRQEVISAAYVFVYSYVFVCTYYVFTRLAHHFLQSQEIGDNKPSLPPFPLSNASFSVRSNILRSSSLPGFDIATTSFTTPPICTTPNNAMKATTIFVNSGESPVPDDDAFFSPSVVWQERKRKIYYTKKNLQIINQFQQTQLLRHEKIDWPKTCA